MNQMNLVCDMTIQFRKSDLGHVLEICGSPLQPDTNEDIENALANVFDEFLVSSVYTDSGHDVTCCLHQANYIEWIQIRMKLAASNIVCTGFNSVPMEPGTDYPSGEVGESEWCVWEGELFEVPRLGGLIARVGQDGQIVEKSLSAVRRYLAAKTKAKAYLGTG